MSTISTRMSRHAVLRSQQRGIRRQEIDMVITHGTSRKADRYVLDRNECNEWRAETKAALCQQSRGRRTKPNAERIRELQKQLSSIDRAMKTVVVLCDSTIVTTYRH